MRTYTCLITDERFAVPSLMFQGATDDAAMQSLALAELRANPHYLSFEARLGDAQVFTLTRPDVDAAQ